MAERGEASIPRWLEKEVEGSVPQVRTLGEMVEILYDQEFAKSADLSSAVYRVYRNIRLNNLGEIFSSLRLRYDVTVLSPLMLGAEYAKTYGHYHSEAHGGLSYAEVYEVLEGTAHVLLQRAVQSTIVDVVLVEGARGEKIVIPPGYGHVLINPGVEPLITGNLVSEICVARYEFWRRQRGGAYYELEGRRIVRNPCYGDLPDVRFASPSGGFPRELRLTDLLSRKPEDFRFLADPEAYSMQLYEV